jgi:NAD(P)H-hydrate repair Nnr-like enzyme with NAD(P)H-hydrate epimerase domain
MNPKPMIEKVVVVKKVAATNPDPQNPSFDPSAHPPEYEMHVFLKSYDDRASDAMIDSLLLGVGIKREELPKYKDAIRALSFGDYVAIDVPQHS